MTLAKASINPHYSPPFHNRETKRGSWIPGRPTRTMIRVPRNDHSGVNMKVVSATFVALSFLWLLIASPQAADKLIADYGGLSDSKAPSG